MKWRALRVKHFIRLSMMKIINFTVRDMEIAIYEYPIDLTVCPDLLKRIKAEKIYQMEHQIVPTRTRFFPSQLTSAEV